MNSLPVMRFPRSHNLRWRSLAVSFLCLLAWQRGSMQAPAPVGGPWAGWARCEIDVQGSGYADRQVHTWQLTGGPPRIEGAFRVFTGTWSVVGSGSLERTQGTQTLTARWATNVQGMGAPIAVFVRASDGRMLIQARHAQLRSPGAVAGYQQQTVGGKPQPPGQIAAEAFEWSFPMVDGPATSTSISGSGAPNVTGSVGYMQPGGSRGTASCSWRFERGSASPVRPPALTPQPVPVPPVPGQTADPDAVAPVAGGPGVQSPPTPADPLPRRIALQRMT